MGIKDLWTILTPYCERKPLYELEGKVIAIDLAGWVCESLNVVDYFIHPKQYLKNLFFRTCYLLSEGITPVFVLEGKAPKLKYKVIAARNEIQFRGVKPKNTEISKTNKKDDNSKEQKGRTRFNYVLKQCENLLQCMGLQCIEGAGEAEAFCAFLNKHGFVEGVVSQDSDCFAYGAIKVYRNFSVSSGINSAGQGGSIDVYDMKKIIEAIDLGQNKIIVMALLCGCDYCPDGVNGVGRDSVIKLFKKYKDSEILSKIKTWRENKSGYTTLEMRANDKSICSNCGHLGKLQNHSKNGCVSCKMSTGCDSSLWKEQRLQIKAELALREKALADPNFPSQEIIDEFLNEPNEKPKLNLNWSQPNLIKFIKIFGHLLQWTEIYCFQKFFPILTRWQIRHHRDGEENNWNYYVIPDFIKKKRVLKGVACYEIVWKDEKGFFNNLIPDDQLQEYIDNNPKGMEYLWSTVEPKEKVEKAYPILVENFIASKEKSKNKKTGQKRERKKKKSSKNTENDGINDMSSILKETEEIEKKLKKRGRKKECKPLPKGVQMITNFLIRNTKNNNQFNTPIKIIDTHNNTIGHHCSTPKDNNNLSINFEDDDENNFNFSEIINAIVNKSNSLKKLNEKSLEYEQMTSINNISTQDDMILTVAAQKRNSSIRSLNRTAKKLHIMCDNSLSFEKEYKSNDEIIFINSNESKQLTDVQMSSKKSHIDRFKSKNALHSSSKINRNTNVSYFFGANSIDDGIDEFEKSVDLSFLRDSDFQ